jgi:alanyl-tRNA synthetase
LRQGSNGTDFFYKAALSETFKSSTLPTRTMRPDKEVKKEFKGIASAHPDNYYATAVLKREGFKRKHCACGTFFWTVNEDQTVCGDPSCSGGFRLFENNPASRTMTYTQTWQDLAEHFGARGYKVMNRYPVVARWNPTMAYTIASIAAFQPHVISGEVEPPAPRLLIPQFCLRFGDIDNVGITGSHLTGFVMVGQHMFVAPEDWDQNRAFEDLYAWFRERLGLPKEELTFHEDAWAGGGNFGPCMEFFSRGVELCNQVYMLFEQTEDGQKGLSIKVLDMGLGLERCAWFSQGKGTAYDATFPLVIERILERTGHIPNLALQQRFLPKASYLNIDEVDDINATWQRVADELEVDATELRSAIEPMQAVYSIAEHARSLLFAIADGGLPSNVGGGYNLRTIYRRAQGFIEKFGWQLDLGEVASWHAEELLDLFPELSADIENTRTILAVEKEKYDENKRKEKQIVERSADAIKKNIEFLHNEKEVLGMFIEKLVELYDSSGIHPTSIVRALKEKGIRHLEVPDNFFQLVTQRHEHAEQKTATRKLTHFPVDDLPKTEPLYLRDYQIDHFEGTVLSVFDEKHVVLDKTAFYPTSGGQEHDLGTMTGPDGIAYNVVDVMKQGGVIIHVLDTAEDMPQWDEGTAVTGRIDMVRRTQLAQHHTATHIINGAARTVLGPHVWQAGAAKTTEKARIDITHYAAIANDDLVRIETEANRIIKEAIPLQNGIIPKREAELRYGFRLYQGGAVPGREIRVVNIDGFDVEACGGTHLNNTREAGQIRILKASKIQDGIVRIEYVAGEQAARFDREHKERVAQISAALGCTPEHAPGYAEALFVNWKKARKGQSDFVQPQVHVFHGDVLAKVAEILQTQQQNLISTIERFKQDIANVRQDTPHTK